ncbi:hypothetical protein [Sulfurospirillum arcachonense]|uniref:hypothetical protein n=1 Tax=Sulfurospirillum arcachonense TaxID=57666 RepID=UPI000469CC09|nr:hypothetical protein [Sulfurospirillum arcachonense]
MYKILFILLLLVLHVNANESFKETRYIYAIDKKIEFQGSITFLEKSIDIVYTKPKEEKVTYLKEDENLQRKTFYMILQAIHSSNEALLNEYFEIKKIQTKEVLTPVGILRDYIREVEYKKEENILEFIKIQMQNDDWILIETLR